MLDALNRVVVILVILAILAAAIFVLLVTLGTVDPDIAPAGWFEEPLQSAADATGWTRVAIIAISIIVALLMVVWLARELMPRRRRPATFLISSGDSGMATIDRQSVRELSKKTAATVHNVKDVECRVGEGRTGLFISCDVTVVMGTNIPETSAEIQSKVKDSVQNYTGLAISTVDVRARYEPGEARHVNLD